jgi:hypothetical protein
MKGVSMAQGILYSLMFLFIFSITIVSAWKQNNKPARRAPAIAPASASQTPPPAGEISARASDIPPLPPILASKIKNRHVSYVPTHQIRKYPVPAVIFRRGGLARPGDQTEIIEKIIYPAINKSDMPIAAVVVEFFRDRPEIGVTLIWHAVGSFRESQSISALISRNELGHFAIDSFLRLFPEEDR